MKVRQCRESLHFMKIFRIFQILYPTLANGARNQLLDCNWTKFHRALIGHPRPSQRSETPRPFEPW